MIHSSEILDIFVPVLIYLYSHSVTYILNITLVDYDTSEELDTLHPFHSSFTGLKFRIWMPEIKCHLNQGCKRDNQYIGVI